MRAHPAGPMHGEFAPAVPIPSIPDSVVMARIDPQHLCWTLENLAAFMWRAMADSIPGLVQVRVWRDGVGDSCTLR